MSSYVAANQPTDTAAIATRFPADFRWGTATASYQIEGGATEGGRTPSIWDTFSHTPGKTLDGDTGDVACDHYHRWESDLDLMSELGLDAYRLSIAWPRIQPDGPGSRNQEGIDFYKGILTGLRARGISPVVTLYHWDLPQWQQDRGGWPARSTAEAFAEYAGLLAREFGDLVDVWTTFNEPWCAAYLGHASGVHAPGWTDPAAALASVHHLNLAHGWGANAIRAEIPDANISVTLNLHLLRPHDPHSALDADAVRRIDAVGNRAFTGPMLDGAYPPDLFADTAHITDWSFVQDGDEAACRVPLNSLGLNYYMPTYLRGLAPGESHSGGSGGHGVGAASPWVADEGIEFVDLPGERTDMGWLIDPTGLSELLLNMSQEYPDLPLMVTENGAAFPDQVVDGAVVDNDRTAYLAGHISAVADAIEGGANVTAYLAWSMLDNFEWAFGYARRFGIVRVDYDTQERLIKDSGRWFADLIREHRTIR